MNYVYLGKIVNTHGIKGEVRILSDFKFKEQVFKKDNKIYIGKDKDELTISGYRVHKKFDMLTFDNISDINEVLKYKGQNIYFDRNQIHIDGILDEDLIGLDVYTSKYIGKVSEILQSPSQQILVIKNKDHINMVPYVDAFVKKIDLTNKRIEIEEIEGLINED